MVGTYFPSKGTAFYTTTGACHLYLLFSPNNCAFAASYLKQAPSHYQYTWYYNIYGLQKQADFEGPLARLAA